MKITDFSFIVRVYGLFELEWTVRYQAFRAASDELFGIRLLRIIWRYDMCLGAGFFEPSRSRIKTEIL